MTWVRVGETEARLLLVGREAGAWAGPAGAIDDEAGPADATTRSFRAPAAPTCPVWAVANDESVTSGRGSNDDSTLVAGGSLVNAPMATADMTKNPTTEAVVISRWGLRARKK